jgi:hypothetical protein
MKSFFEVPKAYGPIELTMIDRHSVTELIDDAKIGPIGH